MEVAKKGWKDEANALTETICNTDIISDENQKMQPHFLGKIIEAAVRQNDEKLNREARTLSIDSSLFPICFLNPLFFMRFDRSLKDEPYNFLPTTSIDHISKKQLSSAPKPLLLPAGQSSLRPAGNSNSNMIHHSRVNTDLKVDIQTVSSPNNTSGTDAFSSAKNELSLRAKQGNSEAQAASDKLRGQSNLKPFVRKALNNPGGPNQTDEPTGTKGTINDDDLEPHLQPYASLLEGEITKDVLNVVVNMKKSKSETNVTREDIAGLDDLKKIIERKILFPILRPDINQGLSRVENHLVLSIIY